MIDLVYSILPEWNADKTQVSTRSLLTAVARLFRGIDLCRSESMEEAGSMEEADLVMRIPQHTNVGCLAGFALGPR
jgi:hypothetical protein